MEIRVKELKDCEAWVDVNIEGWVDSLRYVVSDRVLDIISNNRDSRIENDIKNFKIDDNFYVLDDNGVVGILKIKESTREGFLGCGEVQVLYLKTDYKGKGYGRLLITKAFDLLRERGYKKVVIGCLVGNRSNEFYKHIGCKFVRLDDFEIFGEKYLENIFEYYL